MANLLLFEIFIKICKDESASTATFGVSPKNSVPTDVRADSWFRKAHEIT
jgi:hypothetical protein